ELAVNIEQLIGVHGEAGEEVLGIARVLVDASVPLRDHRLAHAGNLPDLLSVELWQGESQRDFVARDQAQRLLGRRFAEIESVIQGHQDAEQTHGNADADDGQTGPAPVAPAVFENQWQITKHRSSTPGYCGRSLRLRGLDQAAAKP